MATVQLTGSSSPMSSTVDSFVANLPEFLGALLTDRRCIVAIAEFSDHRYVQFWLDSPSYLIAEVVSNVYIDSAFALTESDEAALRVMGWSEPAPENRPIWFRIGTSINDLIELIRMTQRAVFEVLGEVSPNAVTIRTFEMAR